MKYIDAEKLIAEIERRTKGIENATGDYAEGRRYELKSLFRFIDSLRQVEQDHIADVSKMVESEHIADVSKMMEQPPLPSNLDEVARMYRNYREECGIKDPVMLNEIEEAHYAGAEWMAEQGESFETEIINVGVLSLPELKIQAGDRVIVQIRKKYEID